MTRVNLTKKDLINSIYMQIGFSKNISENLIEDFFATITESLNEDKQKVKVMVSIFGRPTPIELDFFQVEIEK